MAASWHVLGTYTQRMALLAQGEELRVCPCATACMTHVHSTQYTHAARAPTRCRWLRSCAAWSGRARCTTWTRGTPCGREGAAAASCDVVRCEQGGGGCCDGVWWRLAGDAVVMVGGRRTSSRRATRWFVCRFWWWCCRRDIKKLSRAGVGHLMAWQGDEVG